VVGLGDQPLIPATAWSAVASTQSDIAVASFGGRRTPPTWLARTVWSLLPDAGGARALIQAGPSLVWEVSCPGQPLDIDTTEDLARRG
jgi:CTP:molybdopterin cytidylyltransferase MocA